MTILTTAQQIVKKAKNSVEAIEMSERNKNLAATNQDWDDGITTFIFNDDSIIVVSGIDYKTV